MARTRRAKGVESCAAGVLALSIAALRTVRFSARQRAHLQTPDGNTSTPVLELEYSDRNPAAAGPRAGCGGGGRHYNPAAARPR